MGLDGLFKLLLGSAEVKADIEVKLDSKNKECITNVEGNLLSVLTAISILVDNMAENGVPAELIKSAVEVGLEEHFENNKKTKTKVIKVDNKEKAEKIEKLLKELVEDK